MHWVPRAIPVSIAVFATVAVLAAQDARAFHKAETAPEKLLEKIFRLDTTDDNLQPFALGAPEYKPAKDSGYAQLFTAPLLSAWRRAEAAQVKTTCGGKYRQGELCGFDFDPILCAQDYPDTFLFYTLKADDHEATVSYTWPEFVKDGTATSRHLYKLVKEKGRWKLDGVDCGEEGRFHTQPLARR